MSDTAQKPAEIGQERTPYVGIERVIVADGDQISVDEASGFISVSDRIALGEHGMRKRVAYAVMATFAVLNAAPFSCSSGWTPVTLR
jgi:hypothetical protein